MLITLLELFGEKIKCSFWLTFDKNHTSRAWCKTIVRNLFYVTSYNSLAPSSQHVVILKSSFSSFIMFMEFEIMKSSFTMDCAENVNLVHGNMCFNKHLHMIRAKHSFQYSLLSNFMYFKVLNSSFKTLSSQSIIVESKLIKPYSNAF